MQPTPAIEMREVTIRYGAKTVVERLSFRLAPAEKATLTGRSGSGKSSVLRCLLGFAVPAEGAVYLEGNRLDGRSVWRLRGGLAYVAQEPDLGDGPVRQVLERPFAYRANAPLRQNLERAPELLERLLLPAAILDQDVADLSGGEKQRIALVVALLLDRPILLLDEPTSALDKAAREAVAECLREVGERTILTVAHDAHGLALPGKIIELPGAAQETAQGVEDASLETTAVGDRT